MSLKNARLFHKHDGVDPELASYVNLWLAIAKDEGIVFHNKVTVGFEDINDGLVIGRTYWEPTFREIDIDKKFWDKSSGTSRMALVFHELGHAYCGRSHNYKEIGYSDRPSQLTKDEHKMKTDNKPLPGYYFDFCPKSIMFPEILSDDCVRAHYTEYEHEMFEECEPY
jgi:hypothetical protein